MIIDQAPEERFSKGLGFTAKLSTTPVIGPALWRVTPDFAIKEGLGVAFAPGYDVPDEFVDEFRRMTYTSYDSDGEEGEYMDEEPLDRRIARMRIPLLAIFGAEDQIYDATRSAGRIRKGAGRAHRHGRRRRALAERRAAGRAPPPSSSGSRKRAAESGEGGIRTHEAG